MPAVSVIIPTYNCANLLGFAIESVLQQSFKDFELIIIDDGSQDDTSSVVRRLDEPRVRYIFQENRGRSAARNKGIQLAKGDYLAFLDADDLFFPDKLQKQMDLFHQQADLGFVSCGFKYIDYSGQPIAVRWPWLKFPNLDAQTILVSNPIHTSSVIVRASWIDKVGAFNESYLWEEDLDLWYRLAAAGCKMAWARDVLTAYRMRPEKKILEQPESIELPASILQHEEVSKKLVESFLQSGNNIQSMEKRDYQAANYLTHALREYTFGRAKSARVSLQSAIASDKSLLGDNGLRFRMALISWAVDPVNGDPLDYLDFALSNLPEEASVILDNKELIILQAAARAGLQAVSAGNLERCKSLLISASSRVFPSEEYFQPLVKWIIDSVRMFPEEIQANCLDQFFKNLPNEWHAFQKMHRITYSRLCMANGFERFNQGQKNAGARAFLQGITHDPRWLGNKGVLSMIAQGMFFAKSD